MSYDNPITTTYSFGLVDFGDVTDINTQFYGPAGKKGRIREVVVPATEIFNAPTTEAVINIGSAAGGAQYAACGLGTTAAAGCYRASDNAGDIVDDDLPADTLIYVEMQAVTGASPTGQGYPQIIVDWY